MEITRNTVANQEGVPLFSSWWFGLHRSACQVRRPERLCYLLSGLAMKHDTSWIMNYPSGSGSPIGSTINGKPWRLDQVQTSMLHIQKPAHGIDCPFWFLDNRKSNRHLWNCCFRMKTSASVPLTIWMEELRPEWKFANRECLLVVATILQKRSN